MNKGGGSDPPPQLRTSHEFPEELRMAKKLSMKGAIKKFFKRSLTTSGNFAQLKNYQREIYGAQNLMRSWNFARNFPLINEKNKISHSIISSGNFATGFSYFPFELCEVELT